MEPQGHAATDSTPEKHPQSRRFASERTDEIARRALSTPNRAATTFTGESRESAARGPSWVGIEPRWSSVTQFAAHPRRGFSLFLFAPRCGVLGNTAPHGRGRGCPPCSLAHDLAVKVDSLPL